MHDERVEDGAGTGQPLDLRQAQVLVGHQRGLAFLEVAQQPEHRLRGVQAYPYRHGVDQQADHGLHAGQLRRPARDGGTEHHVGTARQPGQHQGPGPLHHRVHGQAVAARQRGEAAGGPLGDVGDHVTGVHRPPVGRARRDERRLVGAGELGGPGGPRGVLVLAGAPGEVVAVGRGRGQGRRVTARRVHLGQFGQQDRHGPAVHQDVVADDDEPVPVRAEADQQQPQQWRDRRVEAALLLPCGQLLDAGERVGLGQAGQVDLPPGQAHLTGHDLDGLARRAPVEARAQRGVPVQQRLPRGAQPDGVQRSGQLQHPLGLVDVRALLLEGGLEQQPFLEGRQRPDVGRPRHGGLQLRDAVLGEGEQREVGGRVAARARAGGVGGQSAQHLHPAAAEPLRHRVGLAVPVPVPPGEREGQGGPGGGRTDRRAGFQAVRGRCVAAGRDGSGRDLGAASLRASRAAERDAGGGGRL